MMVSFIRNLNNLERSLEPESKAFERDNLPSLILSLTSPDRLMVGEISSRIQKCTGFRQIASFVAYARYSSDHQRTTLLSNISLYSTL